MHCIATNWNIVVIVSARSQRLNLHQYSPLFAFCEWEAEFYLRHLEAVKIHNCSNQAFIGAGPFFHRHMLGAPPAADEPSLKYELAKSLHAGDIAVLRTFGVSPAWWQILALAPFFVELL